jgi:hypothetical protein
MQVTRHARLMARGLTRLPLMLSSTGVSSVSLPSPIARRRLQLLELELAEHAHRSGGSVMLRQCR